MRGRVCLLLFIDRSLKLLLPALGIISLASNKNTGSLISCTFGPNQLDNTADGFKEDRSMSLDEFTLSVAVFSVSVRADLSNQGLKPLYLSIF